MGGMGGSGGSSGGTAEAMTGEAVLEGICMPAKALIKALFTASRNLPTFFPLSDGGYEGA